jgi:hypothetical protein
LNIERPTSNIEHRTGDALKIARRRYLIALALIALAAATLVLLSSRWGIATSSDSARYIRSARHVLGRDPETPVVIEAPAEQAHYPPLYPATLALLSLGGADPLDAARWLAVILIAANCVFAAELVRTSTASRAAALFTASLVAFTPGSLAIHCWALSEPLYICLTLLGFRLLLPNLTQPKLRRVIIAAFIIGLAMLTRYAGAALIPAGALMLLLLTANRSRLQRWLDAIIFAAAASLLPIAWSLRNFLVLHSATNRVIAFHPVGLDHLIDLAQVCWSWLGADQPIHPALTFASAAIALAVLIAGCYFAIHRVGNKRNLPTAVLIYILVFGAMLAVSISLIDFHTPIDNRVLAPVYIAWLILVGCVFAPLLADRLNSHRNLLLFPFVVSPVLLLVLWNAARSAIFITMLYQTGGGFAQQSWRESGIIAAVKNLPPDQIVYTNAPGAVYLLTARPIIITIPAEFSASSQLPNTDYAENMARMETDLRAHKAVLVYLSRYGKARANNDAQIGRKLGLRPILRHKDDIIYEAAPASTMPITTLSSTSPSTRP